MRHSQPDQLLLYSLVSFRDLIEPILTLARPRTICEIGVEKGLFTRFLIDYCAKANCKYTGIDPTLDDDLALQSQSDGIVFLKDLSIHALQTLEGHDVYFIDGDHNYYTVKSELLSVFRHRDIAPLIFLHDVGWPWGRRDQYCSPESIPPPFRHPHAWHRGVMPDRAGLQEDGFSGSESDYRYAAAATEGGPCNGVLTAVEDALEEQRENAWQLIIVPAVFGLGILYVPDKCNEDLLRHLEGLSAGLVLFQDMLSQLETNRISLFLEYLKNIKQLQVQHGAYFSLEAAYQDVFAQYQGLEGKYQELSEIDKKSRGAYVSLQTAYQDLFAKYQGLEGKYQELNALNKELDGAYVDLHRHDVALQSAYEDLQSTYEDLQSAYNRLRKDTDT